MSKTIFVVDDSATMLMSVRASLEMNGFKVETASDGVQALDKLNSMSPDLIITDINMPRMGGMELIQALRAMSKFRFTPILTLTTESESGKRDQAKQLGATGWLVKPVPAGDLVRIIKQVLPGA
ncbi:response regulator [Thalassolituus sp.]|jgi:two-component system chemotaxis response regulator CheY|uniref:response regulator n=1 Tax=Thalassolituus sp. TaxID=2030822 RepID=UPI002638DBE9|nr:response regulator [uncultured Thalassolituus sp.]